MVIPQVCVTVCDCERLCHPHAIACTAAAPAAAPTTQPPHAAACSCLCQPVPAAWCRACPTPSWPACRRVRLGRCGSCLLHWEVACYAEHQSLAGTPHASAARPRITCAAAAAHSVPAVQVSSCFLSQIAPHKLIPASCRRVRPVWRLCALHSIRAAGLLATAGERRVLASRHAPGLARLPSRGVEGACPCLQWPAADTLPTVRTAPQAVGPVAVTSILLGNGLTNVFSDQKSQVGTAHSPCLHASSLDLA